jgi:hypothetical protein
LLILALQACGDGWKGAGDTAGNTTDADTDADADADTDAYAAR